MYWIPLYEILEDRGFEVYLVNARQTKNLPGRKSDVQESQWLLKLHTYGLLSNSLQPPAEIRVLRTLGDKPQDCGWAVSHHQTVTLRGTRPGQRGGEAFLGAWQCCGQITSKAGCRPSSKLVQRSDLPTPGYPNSPVDLDLR